IFLMVLGYGFSCGTRLYDLPPAELAAHKVALKEYEEQKKAVQDEIDKLNKSLEAPQKEVQKLQDEMNQLKKDALVADLDAYRKSQDTSKLPDWIVEWREKKEVDRSEAKFKAEGWPNPKINELQGQIDKIKEENKFDEVKAKTKELGLQLKY